MDVVIGRGARHADSRVAALAAAAGFQAKRPVQSHHSTVFIGMQRHILCTFVHIVPQIDLGTLQQGRRRAAQLLHGNGPRSCDTLAGDRFLHRIGSGLVQHGSITGVVVISGQVVHLNHISRGVIAPCRFLALLLRHCTGHRNIPDDGTALRIYGQGCRSYFRILYLCSSQTQRLLLLIVEEAGKLFVEFLRLAAAGAVGVLIVIGHRRNGVHLIVH